MVNKPSARHAYVEAEVTTALAHQIRAIRLDRGWTQRELAVRLNTTQTAVSRLEDPSYGKLSIKTLFDLSRVFDTGLKVQFVSLVQMLQETWLPNAGERVAPSFEEESLTVGFVDRRHSSSHAYISHVIAQTDVDEVQPITLEMSRPQLITIAPSRPRPIDFLVVNR